MGNLPLEVVFPMVKITRAQDISQAELFIDFYGHPREDEFFSGRMLIDSLRRLKHARCVQRLLIAKLLRQSLHGRL
jgi:hypothetical protein